MPDRDASPRFPRPRVPEAPSPYRERIAPPAEAPPAERARVVVTRPEPPAADPPQKRRFSGDLGLPPPPPEPAGFFDELGRALRPLAVFAGNHPHLSGLILLLLAVALLVGYCGLPHLGPSYV